MRFVLPLLFSVILKAGISSAEDAYNGQSYSYQQRSYSGSDSIQYWTEYAVLPEKCIHYNGKDVIAFSIYEKYYNHCTDSAVGHYYVDVPTFMNAYVNQLQSNAEDMGQDYQLPDAASYTSCYPYTSSSGNVYYVQIGCADGNSQKLAVNHYKDNLCTTPNKNSYGSDDTTLDVSSLSVPFQQCTQCVNYVDKNVDDVDDAYFDQRTQNAPLCGTIWQYKSKCSGSCRRMGKASGTGWNSSDKILLCLLAAFSGLMFALIQKKRSKMAKKDALLEEAVMRSTGLQQSHLIGFLSGYVFVTVLAGLSTLKGITWTLLIAMNLVLFLYLMKLTIESGLNVPVGSDGERIDEDGSSDEEDDDHGDDTYKSPAYVDESQKNMADVENSTSPMHESSYAPVEESSHQEKDINLPPIT